jgi:hypothetical protein
MVVLDNRCPVDGGVRVKFRRRVELSTGWAEWDEGPRNRVRVGDRLLPRRIDVTLQSTVDDLPSLMMTIEVREGIPQCTQVTIRSTETGREVRSVDLRAARLEDWLESIVASAAAEPTEHGYVIDDRMPAELAAERKRVRYVRAGARRTITDDLLRQVAEIYRANASDRPTEAVLVAFGTSPRTAARYVQQAREREFLPPTTPGKVTT